jgi:hypothetical protein
LLPGWAAVAPWCLAQGDALRAQGPPALTSAAYADAFAEVQALGRADSVKRTPEQTEIALFWNDGPGTQTPPGHWNDIARVVAGERRLTSIQRARLLALLNLGLADAAIVAWDTKYVHDHWRPRDRDPRRRRRRQPRDRVRPRVDAPAPDSPLPLVHLGAQHVQRDRRDRHRARARS